MPELTCAVVEDLLDAYLAGETSEDTKRVLEEHVTQCAVCQAALARRRRAREAMMAGRRSAGAVVADPDSAARPGNGNGRRAHARRVVSRARRRLYAGIAVALLVAVAAVGLGLDRFYTYRTAVPMAVAGAEEYASASVPGWGMARSLGAVQDVDEKVADWLIINSVLFGPDATYVLYTTINRTKVEFTAGFAQPAASLGAGAVSAGGFHGLVTLPPLPMGWQNHEGADGPVQMPLVPPSVNLTVTEIRQLRNLAGLWTAVPFDFKGPLSVSLEFTADSIMVQGETYYPGTVMELLGGTITVDEVVLGYPRASVSLTVDMPEDVRLDGISLRILPGDAAEAPEWMATGTVVSLGDGRRELTLFGPAFSDVPESLLVQIDKVHLQESGSTDLVIPWAEYAELFRAASAGGGGTLADWPAVGDSRGNIIRFEAVERYQLDTVHGTLHIVGMNPNAGILAMEFRSSDDEPVPGEVWPLAPYTFPPQLIGVDGERWSGAGSTQMWENEGRHYYTVAIPSRFAEDNDTFILRFEKRGLEVEVGKSWTVELGAQ